MYACAFAHMYSLLYPLRAPRNTDTRVAVSIPCAQVPVSKYHSPGKGTGLPGEVADSRAGTGKEQYNPGTSCAKR